MERSKQYNILYFRGLLSSFKNYEQNFVLILTQFVTGSPQSVARGVRLIKKRFLRDALYSGQEELKELKIYFFQVFNEAYNNV